VSGFIFPFKNKAPETFFLNYFASWGWATWKDRWDFFEKNGSHLYKFLKQKKLTTLFNINNSYPFTRILRNQIRGNNDSWSIRWYSSLMINNKLVLYPKKSLVQNIGFDGTRTHGGITNVYGLEIVDHPINIKSIPIKQNEKAYKAVQKYFKSIRYERILNKIKRILRNPLKKLKNL
jgi:hypothetical protein